MRDLAERTTRRRSSRWAPYRPQNVPAAAGSEAAAEQDNPELQPSAANPNPENYEPPRATSAANPNPENYEEANNQDGDGISELLETTLDYSFLPPVSSLNLMRQAAEETPRDENQPQPESRLGDLVRVEAAESEHRGQVGWIISTQGLGSNEQCTVRLRNGGEWTGPTDDVVPATTTLPEVV